MAERISGWTLEHEDFVNMLCGVNWSYELMNWLDRTGRKELYDFREQTGIFKWNRKLIEKMGVPEIFEIYKMAKRQIRVGGNFKGRWNWRNKEA